MTKTMSSEVTTGMLDSLVPLRELDADALQTLAGEAEIETFAPKTVVYRAGGRDQWTRYVLSGELVVIDKAGGRRSVVGMGDAGVDSEPLGMDDEHSDNALAATELRLIRLPTQRIRALLETHRLPDYEVADVDSGAAAAGDQLFYQLVQDLLEDRLELPSMPDIAMRVREAVNDADATAPQVAKIIQADPVVAARLLQAANSSIFAGQRSVDSLNAAVIRLGLRQVRELVMAVTMRQVFTTSNALVKKRMVELWMHSTLVAAIAAVMARKLRGFDVDRALIAGLVHDIGVVPMLAHADRYDELARNPAVLEQTIAAYRADIGSMILRRWNVPEELITVALEAEHWQRSHAGPADCADLVIASQLHSYADTAAANGYPTLPSLSVYQRLGLADWDESAGEPILAEAREEIAEVQRFLMG